jgi:hypothetical protein
MSSTPLEIYRNESSHLSSVLIQVHDPDAAQSPNKKILKWLSELDPWAKHKEACGEYRPGTLDWFFDHPTFVQWLNGEMQVLWCPGSMGTGKTVLMSAIVEYIYEKYSEHEDVAVAFFHCQHQSRDVQTLSNILGCLLSQLYSSHAESTNIPPSVVQAFTSRRSRSLTIECLQQWLEQDIIARVKTVILLDGLDEMDQQLRDELIGAIDCIQLPGLQLMVTSRPLPDIGMALGDPIRLDIYAPTSSIDSLITSRLTSISSRSFMRLINTQPRSTVFETSIEQQIRHQIGFKAQGM